MMVPVMTPNSLQFIIFFLPSVAFIDFILKKIGYIYSKLFITTASAWFYYQLAGNSSVFLMLSCAATYLSFRTIQKGEGKRASMILSVVLNVALLCYFKYKHLINNNFQLEIATPIAISFFVFQQISFIVDAYKGKIESSSFLDYLYYILFFPKMIAGPITRWQSLIPQINSRTFINSSMVLLGLTVISIGLFKKVVLSGLFERYADVGYSHTDTLNFIEAWVTSLSYTAQIYFDFSGYSDIAIGAALLLGIRLPDNFNSPYKAVNIRDFWNRWHISLSTWLRDYVYIPLGGSRKGLPRTISNLLITFLVSGAWHGSELNFILWGLMHGMATAINVLWDKAGFSMPSIAGWLITFLFINFSWIPFRAESVQSAYEIFSAMIKPDASAFWQWAYRDPYNSWNLLKSVFTPNQITTYAAAYCVIALLLVFTVKNTAQLISSGKVGALRSVFSGFALMSSLMFMFGGASAAAFIYAAF
ncbi:membrane-bound O-acyltransferase family protein [Cronobacter sakazakii]|nr:membrane-bound O-acyltransferase family protein [Cronobacter sakazakii]